MVKIEGKSVFGGVAIGPIGILKKKEKKGGSQPCGSDGGRD